MSDTATNAPTPSADESSLGTVKGLVEEHPVAMLAGGILLGALVAGVLSRSAKSKSEGKPEEDAEDRAGGKPRSTFRRRAVQLAAIGAELAAAYVAGADGLLDEAPKPAPDAAKTKTSRISGLAATALRTLGPALTRRLGRNKD